MATRRERGEATGFSRIKSESEDREILDDLSPAIKNIIMHISQDSPRGRSRELDLIFSYHMNSIKESRERMQVLQEEIDSYKDQTRDLIAKLQGM